jgi:hypothetical protein
VAELDEEQDSIGTTEQIPYCCFYENFRTITNFRRKWLKRKVLTTKALPNLISFGGAETMIKNDKYAQKQGLTACRGQLDRS